MKYAPNELTENDKEYLYETFNKIKWFNELK